jgi:hypothetical protein
MYLNKPIAMLKLMAEMAKMANRNPPRKRAFLASNRSHIRQIRRTFFFRRQIRQ